MAETQGDEPNIKNFNSNQIRNNPLKIKRFSQALDREQLYAENLSLKGRVKELSELNTKMKTQLSITEK